ncbi:MAG: hypothetical protein PHG97_06475 [Candidatus Margulisbacteria bacterium]|nr:hypothetical protein [Candidatus Margulisiibacteriota bacterium]
MRVNGVLAAPKPAPKVNAAKQPESETIQIGNDTFIIEKDQVIIKHKEGGICGPTSTTMYEIKQNDKKKDKKTTSYFNGTACPDDKFTMLHVPQGYKEEASDQPRALNWIELEAIKLVEGWTAKANDPALHLSPSDKANLEKVLKIVRTALWQVAAQ